MKKTFLFMSLLLNLFAKELNHAPKIEGDIEEKKFVVVVPSYNNEKFYKKNLESIYNQNYSNFRVIYLNDASTDDTGSLVQEFVKNHERQIPFTYIEMAENGGPLSSIYYLVEKCENDEIVVIIDGDDAFFSTKALIRLNQAYSDDSVWVTYGNDVCELKSRGHSFATPVKNLKESTYRKLSFRWSHPKTFYAGLFHLIEKQRLMYEGRFFPCAGDIAVICNLFDLAREHVFYIKEPLYEYNVRNPLNEYKQNVKMQNWYRRYIYSLPPLEGVKSRSDFL